MSILGGGILEGETGGLQSGDSPSQHVRGRRTEEVAGRLRREVDNCEAASKKT